MEKRGVSSIVTTIIIIVLSLVAIGILAGVILQFMQKNSESAQIKSALFEEKFKIKEVVVDPVDESQIDITFCCASGSSKKVEQEVEQKDLDIGLVIDRSGSMEQSGWTLNLDQSLVPIEEYFDLVVPKGDYSSYETFEVLPGTERIAVLLSWEGIVGYEGSDGSEFALNLRRPSRTWIFGNNKPGVGGKVDPPSDVGGPNEYFSGISTKPQMIYIENPEVGTWRVKVWGWNLRPKTNRPDNQNVNISIYSGDQNQISKNPTIISINAAKDSSKDFINSLLATEQLSYTVFGSYGLLIQSLTPDKNDLLDAVDNTGKEGGTAIDTGIETSKDDLVTNGRIGADKVMVVLTDGQNDNGPELVLQEAQAAKDEEIKIFTIGLTGFVDEEMLKEVASDPNYYYYAPDASALQNVFDEVRAKIIEESIQYTLSDKFKVIFYNQTMSYEYELLDYELKPLESKKYSFDLDGKITNVERIEVYPVILTDSGKEIIGQLLITYYL